MSLKYQAMLRPRFLAHRSWGIRYLGDSVRIDYEPILDVPRTVFQRPEMSDLDKMLAEDADPRRNEIPVEGEVPAWSLYALTTNTYTTSKFIYDDRRETSHMLGQLEQMHGEYSMSFNPVRADEPGRKMLPQYRLGSVRKTTMVITVRPNGQLIVKAHQVPIGPADRDGFKRDYQIDYASVDHEAGSFDSTQAQPGVLPGYILTMMPEELEAPLRTWLYTRLSAGEAKLDEYTKQMYASELVAWGLMPALREYNSRAMIQNSNPCTSLVLFGYGPMSEFRSRYGLKGKLGDAGIKKLRSVSADGSEQQQLYADAEVQAAMRNIQNQRNMTQFAEGTFQQPHMYSGATSTNSISTTPTDRWEMPLHKIKIEETEMKHAVPDESVIGMPATSTNLTQAGATVAVYSTATVHTCVGLKSFAPIWFLEVSKFMEKHPDLDQNLLLELIGAAITKGSYHSVGFEFYSLCLKRGLTHKKTLNLLNDKEARGYFLSDTMRFLNAKYFDPATIPEKLRAKYPRGLEIPAVFKGLKELHDKLSKDFTEIKAEDDNKPIPAHEIHDKLHGFTVGDLVVRIPRQTAELCDWGLKLKNCIASYSDRAIAQTVFVFAIYRGEEPVYACEVQANAYKGITSGGSSHYQSERFLAPFVQFMAMSNTPASKDIQKPFAEKILSLIDPIAKVKESPTAALETALEIPF